MPPSHSTHSSTNGVPALTMSDIADLPDSVMSRLTHGELLELIDAAAKEVRLKRMPDATPLRLRDTETLRQLAHLARFTCRNLIRCQSLDGTSERRRTRQSLAGCGERTVERPGPGDFGYSRIP